MLIKLCAQRPLGLSELAALVGRKPKGLRDKYLSRMAAEGRLRMRFPERISHPRQQYITIDDEVITDEEENSDG